MNKQYTEKTITAGEIAMELSRFLADSRKEIDMNERHALTQAKLILSQLVFRENGNPNSVGTTDELHKP